MNGSRLLSSGGPVAPPSALSPQTNCEIRDDHHEDNPERDPSQMLHYIHTLSISPPTAR